MIYERFRAGETTAKPAWNDSASVRYDGNRRPAYAQRSSSSRDDRVRPSAAAMTRRSRSSWAGASIGQQECCDIPARPSFALTPAPHLLYRPQPQQICQTGNVPAYGTLPPVHLCVGTNAYFQPEKFRHSPLNRQEPRIHSGNCRASSHHGLYHLHGTGTTRPPRR